MDRQRFDVVNVFAVILFIQDGDHTLFQLGSEVAVQDVHERIDQIDLCQNAFRDARRNLTAVFPINLVAVVILRIVGSGDVDTSFGA